MEFPIFKYNDRNGAGLPKSRVHHSHCILCRDQLKMPFPRILWEFTPGVVRPYCSEWSLLEQGEGKGWVSRDEIRQPGTNASAELEIWKKSKAWKIGRNQDVYRLHRQRSNSSNRSMKRQPGWNRYCCLSSILTILDVHEHFWAGLLLAWAAWLSN